jgi:hypothetical protein
MFLCPDLCGEEALGPGVAMAHVRIRLGGLGLTRFWPGGWGSPLSTEREWAFLPKS